MKGSLRRKKKRFWKPVMAVFLALYLVTMVLVTLLVKERFMKEYLRTFEEVAASILRKASDQERSQTEAYEELKQNAAEEALETYEELKQNAEEEALEAIDDEREKHEESKGSVEDVVENVFEDGSDTVIGGTGKWNDKERKEFYQKLVNEYVLNSANPDLMISAAAYDKNKKLLAKSCDTIGDTMYTADTSDIYNGPYILDNFLTFEQKEELAEYRWKSLQSTEDYTLSEKYRILIRTSSDGQELYDIYVQELTWREGEEDGKQAEDQYVDPLMNSIVMSTTGTKIDYATGAETGEEKVFREIDSKIVWEWANPDISGRQRESGEIKTPTIGFPYMLQGSYEKWHRWSSSEFLHEFPKEGHFSWNAEEEIPNYGLYPVKEMFYIGAGYQLKIGLIDDPFAYLVVRMEASPWFAAFDYMKSLYLIGLLLTSVCMFLVVVIFEDAYKQQMALEETRRDFTNAMAHELKTPLGIIRNFSENLMEHNMEEKRDYYLTQIIGQTEEMDRLVAEMIEISKMDSKELVLRKEPVSFGELIREEMERFELQADEKNLQIDYQEEEDFRVEGDREYLAKAVWNLLSNAVEYNVLDGRIMVRTEAKCCSIENTGKPMKEEELLHAFDLFYTGNESRGGESKHMGLGLFLAKKILDLHHMSLSIENTEDGVRIVVRKSMSNARQLKTDIRN